MACKLTLEEARIILGLGKEYNVDDIKKAYRCKAMQFHPDKTSSSDYEEFVKITGAYEVLNGKIDDSSGFDYKDIFNKYSNKSTKREFEDEYLSQLFDFVSNPQKFYNMINDIIEHDKPRKVESLVNILEREDYKNARISFESDKSYALNNSDLVIKTLQNNISKKTFYDNKLLIQLDELYYYCTELKRDYDKSVRDISDKVLPKLREGVLKDNHTIYMDSKSFEKYVQDNLALLDKTPFDTSYIEEQFKNKLFKELNDSISRNYNEENIRPCIKKICILDEYIPPINGSDTLIIQSYESFLKQWRGQIITKSTHKRVYTLIQQYAQAGVAHAKKLNKYKRIIREI